MNNQFKIIYNPYEKTIQYQYRSSPNIPWGPLSANSPLASEKFASGTLQNHAEEIVEECKKYRTDGRGVDLYFSGTDQDWTDLKETVARCAGDQITCCDQMEEKLRSPKEVLREIENIFKGLSDQLKSLQNVRKPIDRYRDTIQKVCEPINRYMDTIKPGVNLVVTGTYSAGKSSFINALVGEELLPTSSDPTTAKIYKISSVPGGSWRDTVIRFRYREADVVLRFNENGYYMKAEELQGVMAGSPLKDCLDKVKEDFTPSPAYVYKMIEELNNFQGSSPDQGGAISEIIEIDTPFYRSTLPLERSQFVIYDTPGPNSAKHEEHREVLERALEGQTNGLPILVTDPDNKDTKDLAALKKELSNIQALDISNIMIIFNKADQKGETTLRKIKDADKPCAALDGAEKRGFMLSSLVGLGAKKEDMGQCVSEDAAEIFDEKKPSFLEGRRKLFLYNVLPQHVVDSVEAEGEKANSTGDDRQKLLHNSGLWAVEHGISDFADRYADYNKCQQAKINLSEAIEIAQKELKQKKAQEEKNSADLQKSFDDKKRRLISAVEKTAEEKLKALNNSCVGKRMAIIERHSLNKDELGPQLCEKWKQYKEEDKEKDAAGAKGRLERYVKGYINTQLGETRNDIFREINDFLKNGILEYKTDCIRVVKESDAVNEEERRFLSKFIMSCPAPSWSPPQFKSEDLNISKHQFLFFKWNTFKETACAERVIENINDAIATGNQAYGGVIQRQLRHWKDDFIKNLLLKLADFNPELKDKQERLKESRDKAERLSSALRNMEKRSEDIRRLFQFSTEEE